MRRCTAPLTRPYLPYELLEGKYFDMFRECVKSEKTLPSYQRSLIRFLTHIKMDVDGFVDLGLKEPKRAQDLIIEFLLLQKRRFEKKEISGSTIKNMKKPIKLLLEVNDVSGINWKKISRILPPERRYALDRAPTIEELRLLHSAGDLRERCCILIMISSGIRLGAWDYLKVGHITPVRENDVLVAGRIMVYAGEEEQYHSYTTPEAYRCFEEYIDFRKNNGEEITLDSPVLRNSFGIIGRAVIPASEVKPMIHSGVKNMMMRVFRKSGLRTEKKRRHEFSVDHGFRKYFKTRAEQVMKPINVETLMGHSTGISDSYYRPTEKDLVEDYIKAIPLLTISEAEEVRRQSQLSRGQLEERLRQVEDLLSKIIAQRGRSSPSPDQNHSKDTSNNKTPKKVVNSDEIDRFIELGWEPVFSLADGRVVMKVMG